MSFLIHLSLPVSSAMKAASSPSQKTFDELSHWFAKRGDRFKTPIPDFKSPKRQLAHLERCDLIIAPLLIRCFRVGIEIERASTLGIPVLFISWGDVRNDPGCASLYPKLLKPWMLERYSQGIQPLVLENAYSDPTYLLEQRLLDRTLGEIVAVCAERRRRPRTPSFRIPDP